ncbi:hypothetical protein [Arthrobacter sp. L77]|uniref:hypothetical protein n=1 Tax=Arthrobacter sp. L77 TaxID=1496689 RepID=UPI0005B77332|nr:hypothetical protein [Arthrobacter sp. L77]
MTTNEQQEPQQDVPEVNTPTTPQQDGTPDQPDATGDGKGTGNKEAAKYRRQLRETETERDALVETVGGLQRQIVAGNLPHGSKMNADALWTAGRKPGDFFDEKGLLDTGKLTAAVRETHVALGVHFGPEPVTDSGKGTGTGLREERATLASEARKRQG